MPEVCCPATEQPISNAIRHKSHYSDDGVDDGDDADSDCRMPMLTVSVTPIVQIFSYHCF